MRYEDYSYCVNYNVKATGGHKIFFHTDYLRWRFEDKKEEERYYNRGYYRNAIPSGYREDKNGNGYLSVIRWYEGVPATLNKVEFVKDKIYLTPYPSAQMNRPGDANALQCVLGFVIDELEHMWILDQGHYMEKESIDGSQKLVCWDTKTNTLIKSYKIDNNIASYKASFLNDLVVDNKNGFVYISDSGVYANPIQAQIIVFDMKTEKFKRRLLQHQSVMDAPGYWFKLYGKKIYTDEPMRIGVNGIALSVEDDNLYYSPLTSRQLYSIPTKYLRDFSLSDNEVALQVRDVGNKFTNSDGMWADNRGNIYYSMLENHGIGRYEPKTGEFRVIESDKRMAWVGAMQILDNGELVFTSNSIYRFMSPFFNEKSKYNFIIWKSYLGKDIKSYTDV